MKRAEAGKVEVLWQSKSYAEVRCIPLPGSLGSWMRGAEGQQPAPKIIGEPHLWPEGRWPIRLRRLQATRRGKNRISTRSLYSSGNAIEHGERMAFVICISSREITDWVVPTRLANSVWRGRLAPAVQKFAVQPRD